MLSIVSTPIGNLGDITVRAKETLTECDAIICEDTRVAGHLLHLLGLPKKELVSFHGHSDPHKLDPVIARLKSGTHFCLVSDAGTPGISDPGYALTSRCRIEGIPITVLPGAAAFLAALSISGLPINAFLYLGFLPLKKGRQTLLKSFALEERTIVFYESVHRIEKTLHELSDFLSSTPDRSVVICRELTKLHEEVLHATVATLKDATKTLTQKGEFVIVVGAL